MLCVVSSEIPVRRLGGLAYKVGEKAVRGVLLGSFAMVLGLKDRQST